MSVGPATTILGAAVARGKRIARRVPGAALLRGGWHKLRSRWLFARDFARFRRMAAEDARFSVRWEDRWPCLKDRTATTPFDRHYVYHPAWAARVLARTRPPVHVDIASSLHFCSIVSAFCPVEFYDYRPPALELPGLECRRADLTALPFPDRSVASLSCMHVLEHVGLGRYGDPLDPTGDLKAARELKRVLAPGADLLVVVPVGTPRLQFNAHRIYSYAQVLDMMEGLRLQEFALVPDTPPEAPLLVNPPPEIVARQRYACGCFWFVHDGR